MADHNGHQIIFWPDHDALMPDSFQASFGKKFAVVIDNNNNNRIITYNKVYIIYIYIQLHLFTHSSELCETLVVIYLLEQFFKTVHVEPLNLKICIITCYHPSFLWHLQ